MDVDMDMDVDVGIVDIWSVEVEELELSGFVD